MKTYVCVLSTDNYLDGILVLNENLKKVHSKYPLLCLINENIMMETKKVLSEFGISYRLINNIKFHNENETNRYWKYTFDKLNIFSLVEYEKLVYLDADLLILDNLDDLFEKESPSMPIDLPFDPKGFNSGIMVIEPNVKDYDNMKKLAIKHDKEGLKISDQNVINEYFKKKIHPLPYGYNMVRMIEWPQSYMYNIMTKQYETRHNVKYFLLESEETNKILHYIGGLKPFMVGTPYDDSYYHIYSYYYHTVEQKKLKNRMNKKLISIIIPIYNREKYLRKCLDSILDQTYKNLEIILVNDGSTDKSLKICKEYAKKDPRFVIVNKKKNEGVSAARNKGLELAKGDYIGFVDSDDSILPNMYEKLLEDMEVYNPDFVQCGAYVNGDPLHSSENRVEIYDNNDIIVKLFLTNWVITSTVWDKLYKKSFLKNKWFNQEYRKNEDVLYIFDLVKNANKIVLSNLVLYNYTFERKDALTGDFCLENDRVKLKFLSLVEEFILTYYPKYKKELVKYLSYQYGEILDGLLKSVKLMKEKDEIFELIKKIEKFIKNNEDTIEEYKKNEMIKLITGINDRVTTQELKERLNILNRENKRLRKKLEKLEIE